MIIKLNSVTGHIPAGDYRGTILEVNISADKKYFWMKVKIADTDEILNISTSFNSILLNEFLRCFCDDNGEFSTEDILDVEITFSVIDKIIGEQTYSKFSALEPVFEEEEEDEDRDD